MKMTIALPWQAPPLSMNDRKHWRLKAKLTKALRETTRILAIASGAPKDLDYVAVELHYRPRDRRRRDADNLVPVLKACCDGLVDYGVTSDDVPEFMGKAMPFIHPPLKGEPGRMWLDLTWQTIEESA